ncbi:MAG: CapA family protein [Pedobacter sp.]|nr:MAG: CapA family protein [Pedobacter sp.]
MKNIYNYVFCSAIILIILSCTVANTKISDQLQNLTDHQDSIQATDTITITAVGDIMLGSAYPTKRNLPKDDARNSFRNVSDYLKGDIVFGNLEGCLLDTGKSTKCKDTLSNSCFAFRVPERYAGIIKEAGFNLLSLANNHVGDFGLNGRKKTTAILDSLEIKHGGLLTHPYSVFVKDSITYAFCAFSPNDHTLSINEIDSAKALVNRLDSIADIVIVSFHGGAEGAKHEHVPKKDEIFYKENRGNVYAFAHAVIDSGADIVLGHGPHVTRAVEVYKNKFIAYSLGNFCTYGMFNLNGPNGIAPIAQIKMTSKGNFIEAKITSVKQDKINRLTVDKENKAFYKMRFLTNTDFPGNNLEFLYGNTIRVKNTKLRP